MLVMVVLLDQEIVVDQVVPLDMLEAAAVDKVTVLAAEAAVVVLRQLVLQTLFLLALAVVAVVDQVVTVHPLLVT